jgi:hypothetical protein
MEDQYDTRGEANDGSHWCALQVNKYPKGDPQPLWFDPYGVIYPDEILDFIKMPKIPYNTKDIQSILQNYCGFACLAFGHYINAFNKRSGCIYTDADNFLSLFEDLSTSNDYKFNEFVLKQFFQPKDPSLRKEVDLGFKRIGVDVESISTDKNTISDFIQPK